MWKIRRWLIKMNPLLAKQLKREKKWNINDHVKEVQCHGYGKNDKYKSKKNVVCFSLAPSYPTLDSEYHSFVIWPRKNKR